MIGLGKTRGKRDLRNQKVHAKDEASIERQQTPGGSSGK